MRAPRSRRCWSWARCRSSTRTTRWRPPRSATATTTGWPRAWRRWRAPTAWCCCRTSTACTPPIRTAIPSARLHPRRAHITPRDRGDGGRLGLRRGLGRHGDQDRRGAHRGRRRLPHVHRRRRTMRIRCSRIEAGARCTWFVPALDAGRGAQAVDRRHAAARGRDAHRCRRAARRCAPARACCRRASPARWGASSAATP